MKQINKTIIDWEIAKYQHDYEDQMKKESEIEYVHENMARPERLIGETYKIKSPISNNSMFITINDVVLNEGTEHEQRYPFEIFINSKNTEHFQWMVALTRIISAVFQKGGECTFLIEELYSVFDPQGGYFKKGKWIPSLVAEIGDIIEKHFKNIGLLKTKELDTNTKEFIEQKQQELQKHYHEESEHSPAGEGVPKGEICQNPECRQPSVHVIDGCRTCLSCGDSKCG